MELKNGLRVEIKRATKTGIIKSIAEYFECNGIQYGIVKDSKEKSYYLIHLDTGYSVAGISFEDMTGTESINFLKQKAGEFDKKQIEKAVSKIVADLKSNGLTYPLN